MNAHASLRAATREAHERVDRAFAEHDLTQPRSYGRFLQAHAAALLPLEVALAAAGAAAMIEEWDEHRRASLLTNDLAELGLAPAPAMTAPSLADEAELAGALYVLEGSRLGGAVLRRQVPPGLPAAFLGARQTGGRWTRFVASLDQMLYSPQRLDAAIRAALDTFNCFERAACRMSIA